MECKTLKQKITFGCSPMDVYEMIMDQKLHSSFTGGPVVMSRKVKGQFKIFDGYVHGHNLELAPGKLIKQAWCFAEKDWPDDHFSICTFELSGGAKETFLRFTQTELPDSSYENIKKGWHRYYWKPMKELIASK